MTKTILYTVSKSALIREALAIEANANDSLTAWILLGQSDRYSAEMKKARAIRSATEYKSPAVRRDIMRGLGYEFARIA